MGIFTSIPVSIAFASDGYFLINAAVSGSCSMVRMAMWKRRGNSVVKGVRRKCNSSKTRSKQNSELGDTLLFI
jgi:hypothetical protein